AHCNEFGCFNDLVFKLFKLSTLLLFFLAFFLLPAPSFLASRAKRIGRFHFAKCFTELLFYIFALNIGRTAAFVSRFLFGCLLFLLGLLLFTIFLPFPFSPEFWF